MKNKLTIKERKINMDGKMTILDAEIVEIPKKEKPSKIVAHEVAKLIDEQGNVDVSALTPTDKERYSKLTRNVVITDINSVTNYGSELQTTMTKYSNDFLSAVRSQQSGEMGELITNLLVELDYIDVDELKAPTKFKRMLRKIPIVKNFVTSVEKVMGKYDTISKNIDKITSKIAATRMTSLRDNNALQVMFENNIEYYKQIEEYIIGGKLKLAEIKEKLDEMMANPNNYEAHQIQDMQEFYNNLDRRLTEMLTLRYVIKQSLPQIRTVQYNNLAVADKAQSIIATTIPVWKNQLSIAVALHRQSENIKAQRRVTDTTNEIIRKNAEMLHQNSVTVAKENERGVIDVETLRNSTQKLIDTIKEVKQIHESGAAKRRETENEILRIERELENSMQTMTASYQLK